jgi:hypothetical protein
MGGRSKLRREYIRRTCKASSGSRANSILEASRTRDNAIPKIFEVKGAGLKCHISCQDVLLPKGFGMKNKSQSWICSVYYHSKCCMEAEKRKNNISGRKYDFTISPSFPSPSPGLPSSPSPKTSSLPYSVTESLPKKVCSERIFLRNPQRDVE